MFLKLTVLSVSFLYLRKNEFGYLGVIKMKQTKILTLSGLMLSLATALSFVGLRMPFGGSMTLGSMIPIIAVSYILNLKQSLLVSVTYSLLQMVLNFAPPPVQDFSSFFAVIILDYFLAFGILGFSGLISSNIKNTSLKYMTGAAITVFLRFLCHLLSGVLIWKCYAPEGQSPFVYSLLYNGGYMGGELILTTIVMGFMGDMINSINKKFN